MRASTITVDEAKQQKRQLYHFITIILDLLLKEAWETGKTSLRALDSSENIHDSSLNELRQAQTPWYMSTHFPTHFVSCALWQELLLAAMNVKHS